LRILVAVRRSLSAPRACQFRQRMSASDGATLATRLVIGAPSLGLIQVACCQRTLPPRQALFQSARMRQGHVQPEPTAQPTGEMRSTASPCALAHRHSCCRVSRWSSGGKISRRREPYGVYRRSLHGVDCSRWHSVDAGVASCELRQSRLHERSMDS